MAALRRGSKLRERLQEEIDEARQNVQSTDYDLQYYYQQMSYVHSNETDPIKRQQEMAYLQGSINHLQNQMVALQHRLSVAIQDLADFEDATAEVDELASREERT